MVGCNVNIPYYGKGKYLHETVHSVLSQTLPRSELEITVFDDQCPEPAQDYLSADYQNALKIIRHLSNLGMVRNWNQCLTFGEMPYVHILHGDDLLDTPFYATVLPVFEEHKDVGMIYTQARKRITRKTSAGYWTDLLRSPAPSQDSEPQIYRAGDEAVQQVMKGVRCSSVILRREAANEVGLFREDLAYSTDEEYWARLASRWSIAYINRPLAIFRYHSANHELATWVKADFWEQMQTTRSARAAYLTTHPQEETGIENRSMARLAVSISHALLAKGKREFAHSYLERASQLYPQICEEKAFKRVSKWLSQKSIGVINARILSPF